MGCEVKFGSKSRSHRPQKQVVLYRSGATVSVHKSTGTPHGMEQLLAEELVQPAQ